MFDQKEYMINYYKQHKNKLNKRVLEWKKNNSLKVKQHNKTYKTKHKKELSKKFKIKETKNLSFKISNRLRHRTYLALKAKNSNKNIKFKNYIGCSIKDLINYLELKFKIGMSWKNYGKWHIDHIIPCSKFNLNNQKEQFKCFHYTNLQPMWAEENLKKGNK